jgi:hypothetical protein
MFVMLIFEGSVHSALLCLIWSHCCCDDDVCCHVAACQPVSQCSGRVRTLQDYPSLLLRIHVRWWGVKRSTVPAARACVQTSRAWLISRRSKMMALLGPDQGAGYVPLPPCSKWELLSVIKAVFPQTSKIFTRFPVTSNLWRIHGVLNVGKKITNCTVCL